MTSNKGETKNIDKKEVLAIYEGVLWKLEYDTDNLEYLNDELYKTAYAISNAKESHQYNPFELIKKDLTLFDSYYRYKKGDFEVSILKDTFRLYDYDEVDKLVKKYFGNKSEAKKMIQQMGLKLISM